jgi:hypothetical protein
MSEYSETPDEIEAALAKREQLFEQWAKSREAANMVTKSVPAASLTKQWKGYIDAANKSWLEAAMAAVGEVLVKERKAMRAELEAEVLKLRNEFLQDRLDQERGVKRPLRVVGAVQAEQLIG